MDWEEQECRFSLLTVFTEDWKPKHMIRKCGSRSLKGKFMRVNKKVINGNKIMRIVNKKGKESLIYGPEFEQTTIYYFLLWK